VSEDPASIILQLSVSAEFIARRQSAELSWNVANAETVSIEPGIGSVASAGSKTVSPLESVTYTLTATGPAGTKTQTVQLNVFPTPVLEQLKVPTSPVIRLKALFTGIRKQLPEISRIAPLEKAPVRSPKIRELNTRLIPSTRTVDDLSNALNIPKADLYASIGQSENRLRTALFNRLERLFSNNPKMSERIKTIRKNYE
jgi:hypothetical protein